MDQLVDIDVERGHLLRKARTETGLSHREFGRLIYGEDGPNKARHLREMERGARPIPPQTLRFAGLLALYARTTGQLPLYGRDDELIR